MFKVSQDINLNSSNCATANQCNVLETANDSDVGSPDVSRIQILNFPNEPVPINSSASFMINRCGIRGTFEIIIESPLGKWTSITPEVLDSERLAVQIQPTQEGIYRLHIKCNSLTLPRSPYMIVAQNPMAVSETKLPVFHSDASKVMCFGQGLERIELHRRNEFRVDASRAGDNILFVGICGPRGQCDEVSIKHIGSNVYSVIHQVQDPGMYMIAIKWGDDHIPGSPFHLRTI